MTKKRFRRGLAALGILAAFFLALMVLLFAPSLASAEKNSGPGHQHAEGPDGNSGGNSGGAPNPIYSEHSWQETEKVNWNAPPAGPCADGSCTGEGGDDTQYFADGLPEYSGHSSNEPNGNGGPSGPSGPSGQGNGSDAPHNGFAGGYGGGFPGGIFGGGNPQDQFVPDHTGDGDSDKCDSDKADADKADADKCDSDKDDSGKGDSGKGSSDNDSSGNGSSGNGGSGDQESSGANFQNSDSPDGPYDLPPVDPEQFADPNPETPPTDRADDLPQQIPEPLTLSLFAVGLAGSVAMRRRVKTK